MTKSEKFENIICTAERKRSALFQIQDLDNAVVHQHGVTPRPHSQTHRLVAEIQLATNCFREVAISIRQQKNLVLDLQVSLPSFHDEGVVHGNAGDGFHSFGLEFAGLLHESRKVFLGASWGEGAGDGEEDGFLALGEVGDGGGLELASGVEVGEGGFWELVAHGDGGGDGGGESEGLRVAEFEGEGGGREKGRCGRREGKGFGGREEPAHC